ncbi:MAG TPA: SDR family NAD(P)-dependent oxidoreductase, partial [Planctomycetota bacterium]|nr:SDR family NAD(P)-dependent oxidoreductase [Planctomycetota bacterium]
VGDALGPIAALLSTAGAFAMAGIGQDPADELQAMLDANLLVNTSLARAVIGPMKRRRTGSLVFTGARAVASAGGAGMANYLASKAALHEYVRALAGELAGSGVRAAAVLPGTIDTANNRKAMPDADRSGWLRVDAVVQALVTCAFGTPDGPGPLYPVSG